MTEIYIGFKISKSSLLQEWTEGIHAFDFDSYIIRESEGYHSVYTILSRTVYDLNHEQIKDLLELMETIQERPFESVIRFVGDTPNDWIYYTENEEGERIEIRRIE